jgi:hypothetical protein
VPYTLDPLLASLARAFVDDADLSDRLRRLFQVPPLVAATGHGERLPVHSQAMDWDGRPKKWTRKQHLFRAAVLRHTPERPFQLQAHFLIACSTGVRTDDFRRPVDEPSTGGNSTGGTSERRPK